MTPNSRYMTIKEYAPSIFQRIRDIDNVSENYLAQILRIEDNFK